MKPLQNATVIFDLHLISEAQTKIPELVLPVFRQNLLTDANGYAISTITFTKGLSGTYYIRPILLYPYVDLANANVSSTLKTVVEIIIAPDVRSDFTLDEYNFLMDGLDNLKNLNLLDFCFGDTLNFTLETSVGSISLLNETQKNSRYMIDHLYFFRIQVLDLYKKPLKNQIVNITFNLLHFPSYMITDYAFFHTFEEFKALLIEFEQNTSETDENGMLSLKFFFFNKKIIY